ncbi:MAG: hypothetical protein M3Q78_07595 [Acidobacteriota bacterium]|nr:hypothetical protein [Acidobacteriota bacterium]
MAEHTVAIALDFFFINPFQSLMTLYQLLDFFSCFPPPLFAFFVGQQNFIKQKLNLFVVWKKLVFS